MTTERRPSSGSRALSWLVASVAIAWLVVYNAMRLAGSNPADLTNPCKRLLHETIGGCQPGFPPRVTAIGAA